VTIVGTSWLYNLEAYQRLFPAAYTSSTRVVRRFQAMPPWGQFLDRHGQVNQAMRDRFLRSLALPIEIENLGARFPFQPLTVAGSARDFYELYGI
jgi:hypothetical protein